MKNQSRILKNGSHPAAVSQAQKHHSATRKRADDCVTLKFQDVSGAELLRLDVKRGLYVLMEQACKDAGLSMAEFICRAVQDKFRKTGVSSQIRKGAA